LTALTEAAAPEFVAVEWDGGIAARREPERLDFVERWGRFRHGDPPTLVQQLAEVIGWESDASLLKFPDVRQVCLDEGRVPAPSSRPLGLNRRIDFEYALAPEPATRPVDEVLPRLHNYCVEDAARWLAKVQREGWDAERDEKWATTLEAEATGHEADWSLVIVGALHASRCFPRTVRRLLEAAGHRCETKFLVWEPQC
jgi:hypothetical protein